jgi:hypothetical protein
MKTLLKAVLERHLENFLEESLEHQCAGEGFVYPNLVEHMSKAAAAVYDSAMESPVFTTENV